MLYLVSQEEELTVLYSTVRMGCGAPVSPVLVPGAYVSFGIPVWGIAMCLTQKQ